IRASRRHFACFVAEYDELPLGQSLGKPDTEQVRLIFGWDLVISSGVLRPTGEEGLALTKSASPPAEQTCRENPIEVAFSDGIEKTACISSTASTVSIMRKVASWVALDWLRPGGLAPPQAARQHPRRFRRQWETTLRCRPPRLRRRRTAPGNRRSRRT